MTLQDVEDLIELTSLAAADLFYVVDDTTGTPTGKKITTENILSFLDSDTRTFTNKTLTSPVLNTSVSGTAVLDEDNMASDSATQLATQQSIKAYVDTNAGIGNVVEDTTPQLGGDLDGQDNNLDSINSVYLNEKANANADIAGDGQVWVKTATPNLLYFTDDAGTDFQVATLSGTETLTNKTLTTPTIGDLSNATHDHSNAAGGGNLTNSALTSGVFSSITGLGAQSQALDMNSNNIESAELPTDTNNFVDSTDETKKLAFGLSGLSGSTTRTLTMPDRDVDLAKAEKKVLAIAVSDETTDLTTGTGKATFRMPFAMTLTDIRASVTTAPVGATLIADVNDGGTTIMTTNKLEIDASEKTTETAATAPALTDTSLADDAEITVDIDQIGSSTAGAGLKVYLIGYET